MVRSTLPLTDFEFAHGAITIAVSSAGSDAPTAARPERLLTGDYSATPFLTIQAALDALPRNLGGYDHRVNVGSGTFAGFTAANFRGSGSLQIVGTMSLATLTTGANTGTAGAGSSSTTVKKPAAAADWTVDELRGKLLVVTAGGGFYADTATNLITKGHCVRRIKSNTGDTLVIDSLAGVTNTTVFNIVDAATLVTACASTYYGSGYCAGAIMNDAHVVLRDLKPGDAGATYGILGQTNAYLGVHGCDLPVSGTAGGAVFDADMLVFQNNWLHGGAASHVELTSGRRLTANYNVLDNSRLETTDFGRAVADIDADACVGNAVKFTACHFVALELVANDCTATPLVLYDCQHFEVQGDGLTGTNAGTARAIELGGGGQYILTGATLAGSSSSQVLIEGTDAVSYTELALGTWARRGTFVYWGTGTTRWAGAISGYWADVIEKTADYTFVEADAGRLIEGNAVGALVFTLPNSMPKGYCLTVAQTGGGQITFTPAGGATLENVDAHTKSGGEWAMVSLYVHSNTDGSSAVWVLGGRTAA
jgi:hypothetical protein